MPGGAEAGDHRQIGGGEVIRLKPGGLDPSQRDVLVGKREG